MLLRVFNGLYDTASFGDGAIGFRNFIFLEKTFGNFDIGFVTRVKIRSMLHKGKNNGFHLPSHLSAGLV